MFKVILVAEDGEYILYTGSEEQCIAFCRRNSGSYGEGQELFIDEAHNEHL